MDNMAYLQQISGVDNSMSSKAKKDNPLSKLLNVWVFVGAGIFIALMIAIAVIVSLLNKVDTKDQDLLQHSWWMSYYLTDVTFDEYADDVKSSDIRNMTASFRSVLNEILKNDENLLLSEYGIEVDDLDEETDPIVLAEKETNDKLNAELEQARLSGLLDRVFLREITMQIAYLRAYQSEISERTSNAAVQEFSLKADSNLGNLYNQFHDFKSITI